MNDDIKLKEMLRDVLAPVYDSLVDYVYNMYIQVYGALPANMPEDAKQTQLRMVIESVGKSVSTGFKLIDIDLIVDELKKQEKENTNGK